MKKKIVVNDRMQKNYTYWPSAPVGKKFHPDFKPQLTPAQMLALGVFGGKYMTDCRREFPAAWFRKAKLCPERHDPALNYFGVNASKPLSYWKQKGWIHPEDPRGWFQWYCRYYLGRRGPDDARQIRRWKAMTRHIAQIKTLPERRREMPPPAAAGAAALGLRQPQALTPISIAPRRLLPV